MHKLAAYREDKMGLTLAEKILKSHTVDGEFKKGCEIGLKIDQTLTQDATGTMAYIEFLAMDIDRVKTERSVAYVDHNTLQSGFENADDHRFIASVCKKHGLYYSRPGNGICHQVHLERFGAPGKTLLGSDSHTPTGGGIGMIAIGAGGLDVAVAMGGGAYYITYPKIVNVELVGKLSPWVSAKDVILKLLSVMTVKGGVGKIIEYTGDGVKTLSVPERATITNMGAELGATTSVFPSDETTREFLRAQGREDVYVPLSADPDAEYDEHITIDLSALEPMAACPHSPDNVKSIKEIGRMKIDQVCIGSCTNSSLLDMLKVAYILDGKTVHPDVSLTVSPGSKQVLKMMADDGALSKIIGAGARVLESACGPCIGMGQSPNSGGISLRTFNRNFEGRSGTKDAKIYLVSPEVAAASAVAGYLCDPRELGNMPEFVLPEKYSVNDNMITPPASPDEAKEVEILRGPNIKGYPKTTPLADSITAECSLKAGDNITTDHIMPAGAEILALRSNIPAISEHVFVRVDPDFVKRARAVSEAGGNGVIVAGENYGQGSSREHAALAPRHLGIRAVIALSMARIHRANLVNFGILPLVFVNREDYAKVAQGADIRIPLAEITPGGVTNIEIAGVGVLPVRNDLSAAELDIIRSGGLLNAVKEKM